MAALRRSARGTRVAASTTPAPQTAASGVGADAKTVDASPTGSAHSSAAAPSPSSQPQQPPPQQASPSSTRETRKRRRDSAREGGSTKQQQQHVAVDEVPEGAASTSNVAFDAVQNEADGSAAKGATRVSTRSRRGWSVKAEVSGEAGGAGRVNGAGRAEGGATATADEGSPAKRIRGRSKANQAQQPLEGDGGGARGTDDEGGAAADRGRGAEAPEPLPARDVDVDVKGEARDDDDDDDDDEGLLPELDATRELYLRPEDAHKMRFVLQTFCPALLDAKSDLKNGEGKGRDVPRSLRSLLDGVDEGGGQRLPLRQLRTVLLAMQAGLPDSDRKRKEERSIGGAVVTMISIVDALAEQYLRDAGLPDEMGSRLQQDVILATKREEQPQADSWSSMPSATKYALHMRLPIGDYFTNAVSLSAREASKLDTGHADLVSVAPRPRRITDEPPPTLGERCRISPRQEQPRLNLGIEAEQHARGANLYYGPWASFAPTYDSSQASLSAEAGRLLWHSRLRRRERDRRLLSICDRQRIAPEPPQPTEMPSTLDADALRALDATLDADLLVSAYESLNASRKVDVALDENRRLFQQLQRLQAARLLRLEAQTPSAKAQPRPVPGVDTPDAHELAVAHRLLDSLSSLVAHRPQHDGRSLVPAADVLRAASRSAAIDPRLLDGRDEVDDDPGYWGTLDEKDYGVEATYRKATMSSTVQDGRGGRGTPANVYTSMGPAAFRENETVQMSDPERFVRATALPSAKDGRRHGAGLLERVASGGAYAAGEGARATAQPLAASRSFAASQLDAAAPSGASLGLESPSASSVSGLRPSPGPGGVPRHGHYSPQGSRVPSPLPANQRVAQPSPHHLPQQPPPRQFAAGGVARTQTTGSANPSAAYPSTSAPTPGTTTAMHAASQPYARGVASPGPAAAGAVSGGASPGWAATAAAATRSPAMTPTAAVVAQYEQHRRAQLAAATNAAAAAAASGASASEAMMQTWRQA